MKKLLKLLNQYEHEKYVNGDMKAGFWNEGGARYHYLKVISQEFGFIKWLTEKEKVDSKKMRYVIDNYFDKSYYGFATYEYIGMICSIQDKPLQFLDLLLK